MGGGPPMLMAICAFALGAKAKGASKAVVHSNPINPRMCDPL